MAAEGETGGVSEKMQQWKIWFAERGVGPEDIPRAILAHEVAGVSWLIGSWAVCYATQPAKLVASLFSSEQTEQAFEAARRKVNSWKFLDRMPVGRSLDRARLVVAFAESSLFRKVALPIMAPLKLWVAWKVVAAASSARTRPKPT